ncbi:hypothetical protein Droror1_Dr00024989 [Drosera rotundifolia]
MVLRGGPDEVGLQALFSADERNRWDLHSWWGFWVLGSLSIALWDMSCGILRVVCVGGPRITVSRSLRWAACGAVSTSSATALLVHLFSPECEPQNIAAYDIKR